MLRATAACMLFLAIMTLTSCLFYILATYFEDELWVFYLEKAFGIIFLLDYILSLAAAPVRTDVQSGCGL